MNSLQEKVDCEQLEPAWLPPPGAGRLTPTSTPDPRPHSRAEEAQGSCGPGPTALSDSRFPLIRLATLLPADWPPPLGGPLQSAVGSKAGKAVICVVTSTHFSIGAGERADAPGSSDALWEGEGKWWRGGDGGSWGKSGGWSRGPRGPFRAWDWDFSSPAGLQNPEGKWGRSNLGGGSGRISKLSGNRISQAGFRRRGRNLPGFGFSGVVTLQEGRFWWVAFTRSTPVRQPGLSA